MSEKADLECVFVDWVDANSLSGWVEETVILPNYAHVQSIGWLLSESDDCIVIGSCASSNGYRRDPIAIPRIAIQHLEKVEIHPSSDGDFVSRSQ